ncbi:MAG: ATP-binding protein [Lentisphaeria bacterium]|nr:ATP-binding protein [Lentisphaeria bacterium]
MGKAGERAEHLHTDSILTLNLPARRDAAERLRVPLAELAAKLRIPERETDHLLISADEVFSNIAAYAYPQGGGTVEIQVAKSSDGTELSMTFSDRGIPFDPLGTAPPDTAAPPAARRIGGLGIHIVRHLMDGIVYRRTDDGRNLLTLTKRLPPPPTAEVQS